MQNIGIKYNIFVFSSVLFLLQCRRLFFQKVERLHVYVTVANGVRNVSLRNETQTSKEVSARFKRIVTHLKMYTILKII